MPPCEPRPFSVVAVPVLSLALAASVVLTGQERPRPQVPTPVSGSERWRRRAALRRGDRWLSGTLVAADSGGPVRRASVTLANPESGLRRTATTDEMGRFSFDQLSAGAFTLSANRQGYLDVSFGQRMLGSGRPGMPIQLAEGQRLENVWLRMPRTGVADRASSPMNSAIPRWGSRCRHGAGSSDPVSARCSQRAWGPRTSWHLADGGPDSRRVRRRHHARDMSETIYFER